MSYSWASRFSGKESACQCRRRGFNSWVRTITWRRKWQHSPVFLPGEFHQRGSLVGYSSWGCKRVAHIFGTKTTMTITTNSLFQKNILSFSSKAVCWTNTLFWDSMEWRQSTWLVTRRAEIWDQSSLPTCSNPYKESLQHLYRYKSSNLSRSLFSFLDIMVSYF